MTTVPPPSIDDLYQRHGAMVLDNPSALPDLNCDGSQQEWSVLCAYGCGDPS